MGSRCRCREVRTEYDIPTEERHSETPLGPFQFESKSSAIRLEALLACHVSAQAHPTPFDFGYVGDFHRRDTTHPNIASTLGQLSIRSRIHNLGSGSLYFRLRSAVAPNALRNNRIPSGHPWLFAHKKQHQTSQPTSRSACHRLRTTSQIQIWTTSHPHGAISFQPIPIRDLIFLYQEWICIAPSLEKWMLRHR